jgi:hypothetical protein
LNFQKSNILVYTVAWFAYFNQACLYLPLYN